MPETLGRTKSTNPGTDLDSRAAAAKRIEARARARSRLTRGRGTHRASPARRHRSPCSTAATVGGRLGRKMKPFIEWGIDGIGGGGGWGFRSNRRWSEERVAAGSGAHWRLKPSRQISGWAAAHTVFCSSANELFMFFSTSNLCTLEQQKFT
jgi:hypothetical protein